MTSEQIRSHLSLELLPLWDEHGVDRERGGFFNQLTRELQPTGDGFKRLLVQTRQIHVFSAAWLDGLSDRALETARAGFAFLLERFRDRRFGGWYLTTTLDGEPLDRRKDTYAHAFVLLALGTYFRATRERRALDEAARTADWLDEHLADRESGGYFEEASERGQLEPGRRRQNPHMHLFEAFLALHAASGDEDYLRRAADLVSLLRGSFIDVECGCLREHFGPDWSPAPPPAGDVVEPGHHFEWSFLLHEYARVSGDTSVIDDAETLWRFALRHGVDSEHGGVYDEIDPVGAVSRDAKRLWPQTEYVRALAQRVADDREPAKHLISALERCFERYVDARHGGWNEWTDRRGALTSSQLYATSVYHVYGALSAAARALESR